MLAMLMIFPRRCLTIEAAANFESKKQALRSVSITRSQKFRRITHPLENRYGISSDMQPSDRLTEVARDQSRRLRITLWSDPIGFGKFQLRFPYFIGLTHPQVGLILRKNS